MFIFHPVFSAKNKEIVCLQDKLSELQKNGEKKASDLAKKLEDKEHLMKKAKKFVSVTKGKLLKKEAEVEELSNELQSFKGEGLYFLNLTGWLTDRDWLTDGMTD